MKIPTYDIFSGQFASGDANWIEAVEGLGAATSRMKELAASVPGSYFVFCLEKHQVLASINTCHTPTEDQSSSSGQPQDG